MACPATPITSPRPRPTATARFRSMSVALKRAGITVSEIDYVNAHGTSTPVGDEIELRAVERLLGNSAGQDDDVVDQVLDRPSARRRGRGGGDLLHPRDPRPDRAADAQSRQPLGRDRDRSRAACGAQATDRSRACPIRSASAAPTPRSSSARCTDRRGPGDSPFRRSARSCKLVASPASASQAPRGL